MPNIKATSATQVTKYLVELSSENTALTYVKEDGSLLPVKIHGAKEYHFDGKDVKDYWSRWKSETGHTSKDLTDICIVCPTNVKANDFVCAGIKANVQTVSPTSWELSEIEEYLKSTNRSVSQKRSIRRMPREIELNNGRKLSIIVMRDEKVLSQEMPLKPSIPPNAETEKTCDMATKAEIDEAWHSISISHKTESKK